MKRGHTAPWKITVQFEDDKPFKRACRDRSEAMSQAGVSLRAAAHRELRCTVKMWCEDGSTGGTDIVTLTLNEAGDVQAA